MRREHGDTRAFAGRSPRPAVILAEHGAGLGAVRSLHAVGVPTLVVALDPATPALWSRLPRRKLVPARSGRGEDADLLAALETVAGERPVLIPTSDRFVQFVVRHRRRLAERFAVCAPRRELVEALLDKARETALFERLPIPLPRTVRAVPASPGALVDALGLPLILKPRSFAERPLLGAKNVVVRSASELEARWPALRPIREALLAQEVIPGGDDRLWVCNCTFDHQHALVAGFTFQRLRLAPPHFGVTSYARSVHNPALLEIAATIGRELRYVGPAMIEFKQDPRDGRYMYIELNPRVGMCNIFDTSCGINNVWLAYRLAQGEAVAPSGRQRTSVMFLSLGADLKARRQDGESWTSAVRDYLAHARDPHVWAYLWWRDPWPALRAVVQLLWDRVRRRPASDGAAQDGDESRASRGAAGSATIPACATAPQVSSPGARSP